MIVAKTEFFDRDAYRAEHDKLAQSIFSKLKAKGITTTHDALPNLIFTSDAGDVFKCSYHSFYRYSGRAVKAYADGKHVKYVTLPLEEYMNDIILPIILFHLKVQ